jgi:hypothetical protein
MKFCATVVRIMVTKAAIVGGCQEKTSRVGPMIAIAIAKNDGRSQVHHVLDLQDTAVFIGLLKVQMWKEMNIHPRG